MPYVCWEVSAVLFMGSCLIEILLELFILYRSWVECSTRNAASRMQHWWPSNVRVNLGTLAGIVVENLALVIQKGVGENLELTTVVLETVRHVYTITWAVTWHDCIAIMLVVMFLLPWRFKISSYGPIGASRTRIVRHWSGVFTRSDRLGRELPAIGQV